MIYGARCIGKELLNTDLVNEFREMYQKIKVPPKTELDLIQEFFYLSDKLSLQFDGYICLFINLINEKPLEVNQIDGFKEFIEEKCAPLSLISNLIIFPLNNCIIEDEVFNIIEMPYDHVLNNNIIKDESALKKVFESILNTNVDTLFDLITNLRDDFFDSELYKNYITALKTNVDVKKYEIDIQALFYIIKQIIFQLIMDGQIKFIDDNNIIKFNRSHSLEGNFFEIKYQPSNNLNFLFSTDIIEIKYEGKKELGIVSNLNNTMSQEKGVIINIKGEILSKDGLNMNSPINNDINEFLNKIGHWYRFIDDSYRSLDFYSS